MEHQQQEEGARTIMCNNIAITLAIARATSITLQGGFFSFVYMKLCHHHILCSDNNVIRRGGRRVGVTTIVGKRGEGIVVHNNTAITLAAKTSASIAWSGDFFSSMIPSQHL